MEVWIRGLELLLDFRGKEKKRQRQREKEEPGNWKKNKAEVAAWHLLKTDKEGAEIKRRILEERGNNSGLAFLKRTCLKI